MAKLCTIILLRFFNNDAWTPHCARNLAVRRARQCSSFFEANVGSSGMDYNYVVVTAYLSVWTGYSRHGKAKADINTNNISTATKIKLFHSISLGGTY